MTSPPPSAASPATPARAAEPVHGCVRCGARIPIHESMCEACNPLGLKAPAASQAHGIAFVGIAIAVVIMAVVARAVIADVGPFRSSVVTVAPDPAGLLVTVSVTNEGKAIGSTTCRIDDPTRGGIGPEALFVESPRVEGGATVSFDVVVPNFGTEPRVLMADCGK
jgi:predicted nucleic acid-binding Zn ribbon protein